MRHRGDKISEEAAAATATSTRAIVREWRRLMENQSLLFLFSKVVVVFVVVVVFLSPSLTVFFLPDATFSLVLLLVTRNAAGGRGQSVGSQPISRENFSAVRRIYTLRFSVIVL